MSTSTSHITPNDDAERPAVSSASSPAQAEGAQTSMPDMPDAGTPNIPEAESTAAQSDPDSASQVTAGTDAAEATPATPADSGARHRASVPPVSDATAIRRRSLFSSDDLPDSPEYSGEAASAADAAASNQGTQAAQNEGDSEHSWPASEEAHAPFEALVSPGGQVGGAFRTSARKASTPASANSAQGASAQGGAAAPMTGTQAAVASSTAASAGAPSGPVPTPAPGLAAPARIAAGTKNAETAAATSSTQVEDGDFVGTPTWQRTNREEARSELDILLDGSQVVGKPASRAAAHWLGVLLAILGLPIAWFCLHKALIALAPTPQTEDFHFATDLQGLLFALGGCAAAIVALWGARRSSLGVFLVGVLTVLIGLPPLLIPAVFNDHLTASLERLSAHSALGDSLARMLWSDAVSGRFVMAGAALIMVAVVSHSARRAGRREQEIIDRIPAQQ